MNIVEYDDLMRQMKPPALFNTFTLKPDGQTPWIKTAWGETVTLF